MESAKEMLGEAVDILSSLTGDAGGEERGMLEVQLHRVMQE